MYKFLSRLLPKSLKEKVALKIRSIAQDGDSNVNMKRLRQELDLLHYRIDELSTQLAVVSSKINDQSE